MEEALWLPRPAPALARHSARGKSASPAGDNGNGTRGKNWLYSAPRGSGQAAG